MKTFEEHSSELNISDVIRENKNYDYIIVKIKSGANCPKKYWNKKAVYDKRNKYMLEYNKGFDLSYGSVFMVNPNEKDFEIE
jgi:hypothetical protein